MVYYTRNKLTGVTEWTQDHVFEHPVLGKDLEEVPEGTKPLVPEKIKYEPVAPDLFPQEITEARIDAPDDKEWAKPSESDKKKD
jgi:hypothetical protein